MGERVPILCREWCGDRSLVIMDATTVTSTTLAAIATPPLACLYQLMTARSVRCLCYPARGGRR
jgi:hypothetical protein